MLTRIWRAWESLLTLKWIPGRLRQKYYPAIAAFVIAFLTFGLALYYADPENTVLNRYGGPPKDMRAKRSEAIALAGAGTAAAAFGLWYIVQKRRGTVSL